MSSFDYNYVSLIGHLGQKPEMKQSADKDSSFATVSLATNESWSKDGMKHTHTDWHNIILGSHLLSVAEKFLQKGSRVHVVGKLRTKKWQDKEGNKRSSVTVVAKECRLLDPLPEKTENSSSVDPTLEEGLPAIDAASGDIPF